MCGGGGRGEQNAKNFSNILLNFDCYLIKHFVIHDGFVALLYLYSWLTLESLKYNAYFISETNYHQNVQRIFSNIFDSKIDISL